MMSGNMLGIFLLLAYYIAVVLLMTVYQRMYAGGMAHRMYHVDSRLARKMLFRFMLSTAGIFWLLAPIAHGYLWIFSAPLYVFMLYTLLTRFRPAWKRQGYSMIMLWLCIVLILASSVPAGWLGRAVFALQFSFR